MDLDRNVAWAKAEYDCIKTEPRYMAAQYYNILIQLEQERQRLLERVRVLEGIIERANNAPFDPFPIRYNVDNI